MNKQFHVHSVNQWVACRQDSESMSSSLIDRLDRDYYRRNRVYVDTAPGAHMEGKPDGAHSGAFGCVSACAKDFLLAAGRTAPARPPRRPVAPLPVLRRIGTQQGNQLNYFYRTFVAFH